jgi:hypothetical protein
MEIQRPPSFTSLIHPLPYILPPATCMLSLRLPEIEDCRLRSIITTLLHRLQRHWREIRMAHDALPQLVNAVVDVHAPVFRRQLHVGNVVLMVEVFPHGIQTVQAVKHVWAGKDGGVLVAAVQSEADGAGCLGVPMEHGGFRRSKRKAAS